MKLSDQLGHLKVYVCDHAFSGERPMNYVGLERGDLIVTCGGFDHEQNVESWRVVGFDHLIERDGSLREIGELLEGREAERSDDGRWVKSEIVS